MKKLLIVLLMIPINLLAYSEYVIVGGENIGLHIEAKGLTIVGFYKVNGKYIAKENLRVGDTIIKVEGIDIDSISDMTKLIDENIHDNMVNITILRNNTIKDEKLYLYQENGVYKTGLYIKDKITGIGTMTYIDPNSKIYGSLGHKILMNETENNVEVKTGDIYRSYVTGVDRSINGRVGSKNASLDYENKIGNINKNTSVGVFGSYQDKLPSKDLYKVANFTDIKTGKATIFTTLNSDELSEYEIEITNIDERNINTNKAFSFIVTDQKLLEITGGIVQGMSGSPIVQDGKLIGAVTHVVVDDVTKGYAVFIRTMLSEGER